MLVLTLHYPKGARGIPIYTSGNPRLLHLFKEVVLEELQEKVESAEDEVEALIAKAELQRLRRLFSILIPDGE